MAYRPSRLVVSIPTASSDGRFYGRYPLGNAPLAARLAGAAADAVSAAANLIIGASLQGAAADTTTATGGFIPTGGPAAPTNLLMTNQGGPNNSSNNPLTNSASLSWTAAVAGSHPVASYNIYRNGTLLTNTGSTATTFTDSAATNLIVPTLDAPSTKYVYAVSAVDTNSVEGPQQTACAIYGYRNGVSNWSSGDFSYGGSPTWNDTTGAPVGGAFDILFPFPAAGGGFQPYAQGPQTPIYDIELGGFNYLIFDLKRSSLTNTIGLSAISRVAPGDVYPWGLVADIGAYCQGTMTTGVWQTYKVPLSALTIGSTAFTGSIAGLPGTTTFPLLYGGASTTWGTATLTVSSVQSGVGVDAGGFITGAGVPAGTFIMSHNQSGSVGTFVVSGPNITSATSVASTAMTEQRSNVYKPDWQVPSGGVNENVFFNNIGFST